MSAQGARVWLFPDGYLPAAGPPGVYTGHEAICVVNTGEEAAQLTLDLYFEDREPVLGLGFVVGARRSRHLRLDRPLPGPYLVPREVPYSARLTSSVPVVAQLSRLDVTQPNATLMTTLGHALPEGPL